MTAPQTEATTDPQIIIAALQQRLDAGLAREAALAEELAARDAALALRNSEFGERIEQQAATIDVLKAMSASPGDPQPVFDLIAVRARDLCDAYGMTVVEFDGTLIHQRAATGVSDDPRIREASASRFPMPPARDSSAGRAILERQIIRLDDMESDPELNPIMHRLTAKSSVTVPLMRGDAAIGALSLGSRERGGFSDSQVELLKTFAEQAVIAITSAETYRALQTRTSDLQETLEYQTATSDVLNVISRSTFDLQPVLETVVQTSARLCNADRAAIFRREGDLWRLAVNFGFPPAWEDYMRAQGAFSLDRFSEHAAVRAVVERRPVHIDDMAAVPGYGVVRFGEQRTTLGVPLLREGEAIGTIVLARLRVEPFTDRQIELVSTFADQAVIAIENARLITEQREALEQQTAIAEILQVINSSPGDLAPVFDAILEKAMPLCEAPFGYLRRFDGEVFRGMVGRDVSGPIAVGLDVPIVPDPGSASERLVLGDAVVHIPDVVEADAFRSGVPSRLKLVEMFGARTALWVALRKNEVLLGDLGFYRQEVRPFSDKQIALLQSFAAQAVIAMENARLLNEQREALEQQTATAEVLQVINASPGDLAPVFDAMLDKALGLCNAAFGILWTYDGTRGHAAALRGVPPAFAEYLTRAPHPVDPGGALDRLLSGEPMIHIADAAEEQAYRTGNPLRRALVELGRARTLLAVPLRKDNVYLGHFVIYRREVRPFSDKQIALLQNFAAQAVIAIENARLLTEQQEALERQTATSEVLQVINASPGDLAPVFDAVLERALRLCGASFGTLATYDGERIERVAFLGVPPAFIEYSQRNPLIKNAALIARGIATGKPVQAPDVMTDPLLANSPGVRDALVELGGVRALLQVPLLKDGAVVGFIGIWRREPGVFPDKQIVLLEGFAAQAVIAMENARLLTETREALEQQTATAEVLQVINASPGDLTPVFDTLLERALHLCQSAFGTLSTYDGEFFHNVGFRGVTPELAEFLRKPLLPVPGSGLHKVFEGEDMLHTPDIVDDDAYRRGIPARRALADLGGARTQLLVALRKDGVLLGVLNIFRREVRPFTDKQIALLQNFAAQAVIAMENARLLNEIRQRQEELRITFENMGDGVALFDADLRLAAWNQNFQQIIELPDSILPQRPAYTDYLRLLAERGEFGAADVETELRRRIEDTDKELRLERVRPDGRVIEVRRNAVPGGGFVLIYSDITERKRSEEEIRAARDAAEAAYRDLKAAQANLIQAEKMASLGQLTAGIAHEIKNPLNFVNNFAELSVDLLGELKDAIAPAEPALTEKQRAEIEDVSTMLTSNLEKITEHGKRADGIVKAMLEHSRGSSSERRMVDLNVVIDEALNLAYHGARAQDQSFNITLERDFGQGIAQIEVNPQDMTRVFLNLFSNGFYAATRRARSDEDARFEPTLRVTTRNTGDAVEIRVRDNGTGIQADIRDKLFQPFFTTKPTGEGTGLGLSITYDIVTKAHGGSIAVDSKVGDYSEFTIRLPRNL